MDRVNGRFEMTENNLPLPPSWRTESILARERAVPFWRRETLALLRRGKRRRFYLHLAAAGVAFVSFTALFIWVSTWPRVEPPAGILLVGAGYEENLAVPHNVYGWASLEDFAEWTTRPTTRSWGSGRLRLAGGPSTIRCANDLSRLIDDLGRTRHRTVVVFVSMHGIANEKGAYLLCENANPSAPGSSRHVFLGAVFDALERLPKDKNVVLVLDATQIPSDWSFGMLQNPFAQELARFEERVARNPNLLVLSASDRYEQSWASDDWRQTVFGHFVLEGLKGNCKPRSSGDSLISAEDLYQYVRRHVNHWARANRDAPQNPVRLPSGEVGRQRASRMILNNAESDPVPVELPPLFQTTDDLEAAWARFDRLKNHPPSPAVYTPYLWHRYHAALLRYEQLTRAGDPRHAAKLREGLNRLELEIDSLRRIETGVNSATLTMPVVTGDRVDHLAVRAEFLDLWNAPEGVPGVQKKWESLLAGVGEKGWKVDLLKLRMGDELYRLLIREPALLFRRPELVKAFLRLLQHDSNPTQSVELHFLHELVSHLTSLPEPEVHDLQLRALAQALKTHRLAERTVVGLPEDDLDPRSHAYSLSIFPFDRRAIEQADQKRRRGEDLLFSPEREDLRDALARLEEAEQLYARSERTIAAPLREALATRDRVLTLLPYYSKWAAAARTGADPLNRQKIDPVREMIPALWDDTHSFLAHLDDFYSRLGEPPDPRSLETLRAEAARVDAQLTKLETGFQNIWLDRDDIYILSAWQDATNSLVVPSWDERRLRRRLLNLSCTISRRLHEEWATGERHQDLAEESPERSEADLATVRRRAANSGRIALASIGARAADHPELFEYFHLKPGSVAWDQSVARAGAWVGEQWRRRKTDYDRSRTDLASGSEQTKEWSRRIFDSIARLRRLDGTEIPLAGDPGTGADADPGEDKDADCAVGDGNPSPLHLERLASEGRRMLFQVFLLWQADRTLENRWVGLDHPPYFSKTGLNFLDATQTLKPVPSGPAGNALLTESQLGHLGEVWLGLDYRRTKVRLTEGKLLAIEGPSSETLTDRTPTELEYQLTLPPGYESIPGFAVRRPATSETPELLRPDSTREPSRKIALAQATIPAKYTVRSPYLRDAEQTAEIQRNRARFPDRSAELDVTAFFRGQVLRKSTRIAFRPVADTIARTHPLNAGQLAFRANRAVFDQFASSRGALSLVLDCTGSVGAAKDGAQSAYDEIRAVALDVLDDVPRGTRVAIWVFGQAVGAKKTVEKPEDSVHLVVPAFDWNPDDSLIRRSIQDRLAGLEPWNESPVLLALLKAKEELVPLKDRTVRKLLLISDCEDNLFFRNPPKKYAKSDIRGFLDEEFNGKAVSLDVLALRPANPAQVDAQKAFQSIADFSPPGLFLPLPLRDRQRLADRLRRTLRSGLRLDVTPDDSTGFKGTVVVEQPDAAQPLPETLTPGNYRIRLAPLPDHEATIAIRGGDTPIVEVVSSGKTKAAFRLASIADEPAVKAHAPVRESWQFGVAENRIDESGTARLVASLENRGAGETGFRVTRPAAIWFEVASSNPRSNLPLLRWNFQPGYPAPAWKLDLPEWPPLADGKTPSIPVPRAWWKSSSLGVTSERIDFRTGTSFPPVQLGEDEIRIEGIGVETRNVQTKPGSGAEESRECLVVRLKGPPGKPVWVDLVGIEPEGSEQRFFLPSGQSTALFWPISEEGAAGRLRQINLRSVNSFRKQAEREGTFAEISTLASPEARPARLKPISLPE